MLLLTLEPELVGMFVKEQYIEINSVESSIFNNEKIKLMLCEICCAVTTDNLDDCIPQCIGVVNQHASSIKMKPFYSDLNLFNFTINDMSNDQQMTVKVGKGTYGARPTVIWHDNTFEDLDSQLSIGRYCSLAGGIVLMVDCDHYNAKVSNYHSYSFYTEKEMSTIKQFSNLNFTCSSRAGGIHIGNDVWIGFDVVILPGVTVGDGAIIGARSVVVDNVEPYSIVIGNPARHYKYRFRPEEIKQLLSVKWWEWTDDEIDDNMDAFLVDNDIHAFLVRAKQVIVNKSNLSLSELLVSSTTDSAVNSELVVNVDEIKSKLITKFYQFVNQESISAKAKIPIIYDDNNISYIPRESQQTLNIAVGKHTCCPLNINYQGGTLYQFPDPDKVISIGRYTTIADNVTLYIHPNHCYHTPSTFPWHIRGVSVYRNNLFSITGFVVRNICLKGGGNIHIGSDVRIGSNVLIMSGVTIGDGAIVGESSVIRKSVEPYSIVIGNPARHYKYRFRPEEIEQLLSVKWWEWTDDEIDDNMDALLVDNDIHAFLARAKFLCSLPVYILNTTPAVASSTSNQIKLSDIIGLCIWLFGFLFEVIADEQKRRFRIAKHETHKKTDSQKTSTIIQTAVNSSGNEFIQTGLWSISRHPNYFGEICVWIGLFVFCTGGYTHWLQYMFGMISPIFVFFLLVFVSGIPLLENANNKRWCQNIEYRKYKESTPVLIPFFGRSGHSSF